MVVNKELYLKHHFFKLLESYDVLGMFFFQQHQQLCYLPLKTGKMTPHNTTGTRQGQYLFSILVLFEKEGDLNVLIMMFVSLVGGHRS